MLESLWVWTLVTGLISLIVYVLGTWTHDHFSKKNIPHLKPVPFIGNMGPVTFRTASFPELVVGWYNRLKGNKFGGVYEFLNPVVLLRDPELIKMVTVKDFEHFLDHRAPISEEAEPLFGKALFNLKGQRWKDMRSTLSPAFTSSKMKNMFILITECGKQLTDFLERCIKDKNLTIEGCKIEREWEDDDITAQVVQFFLAGFDTASTLLSFASQLLAMHPDIQSRLQDEIDQTLKEDGGKLTYEAVHGMKYLDMVVSETLRLYPPTVIADRICVKTYTLPAEPHCTLKPGDGVIIPIYALHHDPDYFPDPEKFDPERFSDENKGSIKACTYLPFGSGPRNCIGSRFALMEAKIALVQLLSRFNLRVVPKTTIPIKITKRGLNMPVDGGFWLGLQQRVENVTE